MVDLEYDIFTAVATVLRTAYPGIYVTGEYVPLPPSLPAVSIMESDNKVYQRMRTLRIENAASVMYEVNIYSNKASGKRQRQSPLPPLWMPSSQRSDSPVQ